MADCTHDPDDPIPAIAVSGGDITRDDVELLWADLIDGRYSWQATSARAQTLIETVNVPNHIVNRGLMALYYLWTPDADRDTPSLEAARGRWRDQLAEYDLDPVEWDRQYFRQMLVDFSGDHGVDRARAFGAKLVRKGLLRPIDVDIALPREPG